jgi:hypothetical protein
MNYLEEAVEILGETLSTYKVKIQKLENELTQAKEKLTLTQSTQQQNFQTLKNNIEKEIKHEQDKALATIQSKLSSLRQPRDGIDAVVDYKLIENFVINQISKIEPEKIDYELVDKNIQEKVDAIPQPKIDYKQVNKDIMQNFPKNEILDEVKKEIPKQKEVIGIQKIYVEGDYLYIETTDGKKQKFRISFKNVSFFGGGGNGSSFNVNALEEITSLQETDYIVAIRDGKAVKISAINAAMYFGSGIPINAVTYNGEIVMHNNDIITYE